MVFKLRALLNQVTASTSERGVCQKILPSSESTKKVSKVQSRNSRTEDRKDLPDQTTRQVQVRFLGFLERLAGQRETRVEIVSDGTILDLLEALCQRYGEEFSSSLSEIGAGS